MKNVNNILQKSNKKTKQNCQFFKIKGDMHSDSRITNKIVCDDIKQFKNFIEKYPEKSSNLNLEYLNDEQRTILIDYLIKSNNLKILYWIYRYEKYALSQEQIDKIRNFLEDNNFLKPYK